MKGQRQEGTRASKGACLGLRRLGPPSSWRAPHRSLLKIRALGDMPRAGGGPRTESFIRGGSCCLLGRRDGLYFHHSAPAALRSVAPHRLAHWQGGALLQGPALHLQADLTAGKHVGRAREAGFRPASRLQPTQTEEPCCVLRPLRRHRSQARPVVCMHCRSPIASCLEIRAALPRPPALSAGLPLAPPPLAPQNGVLHSGPGAGR